MADDRNLENRSIAIFQLEMGLEPNRNRTNRTRTLRLQIWKESEQNRTQQWRFFDF